ncbi:hypothetical protein [Sphingomonas sp.]|uniref:hypothetical protein n=1 Tax=Sphingomonas sp. TaxID=28214 RepID=UPI0017BBDF7A|nr:hypothetical protein [Sphingomonas sp.]MBA4761194.1 hypothetical protein [Sphingomonas sp.]
MIRFASLTVPMLLAACSETPLPNTAASNETATAEAVVNESEGAAENMAVPADATAPLLNLAPEALSLVDPQSGRARQLAFGTAREMTVTGATAALGKPSDTGRNGECGEGAMEFVEFGGLTLWFQQDKFVGWFLEDATPKLTTATGAGIGSTRKEVADALEISDVTDSSLGREFTTDGGDFSGLLDGAGDSAKVTALWSGQACIFR